jgi:SAM-dependent methyltransferase
VNGAATESRPSVSQEDRRPLKVAPTQLHDLFYRMDIEKTNTLTLSILEEAPAYHRWIFERIRPWLGKKILEVGCGTGNLTGYLLEAGEVIVSDMNPDYLQIVESKFRGYSNLKKVFLWDIEKGASEEISFVDTIVCSNVLEHIKDDRAALRRFHDLLPPGGKLILLVPALMSLYNSLDRELGHFRRYTRKGLIQKLLSSHFAIYHLKYFNFFGIFGWFLDGTLLRKRLLPAGQVRLFNSLVPLFVRLEEVFPVLIGQSLIAVGEKIYPRVALNRPAGDTSRPL